MPLTDIDSLAAAAQEAAPEREVCLDILVAIELHATGRLGCAGKGRQGRAGVAPSEHVERLDAHAPQAADIDDLIAEALIFEPSAWSVAALLDNLAAVAPPLRTVPNDGPVGFTFALEVGAVLSRAFEHQTVLLKAQQVAFPMLAPQTCHGRSEEHTSETPYLIGN